MLDSDLVVRWSRYLTDYAPDFDPVPPLVAFGDVTGATLPEQIHVDGFLYDREFVERWHSHARAAGLHTHSDSRLFSRFWLSRYPDWESLKPESLWLSRYPDGETGLRYYKGRKDHLGRQLVYENGRECLDDPELESTIWPDQVG